MSFEFIKNVESPENSTELEGKDDQTKQIFKLSQTYEGDIGDLQTKDNILLEKPIVFQGILGTSKPYVVRSFNGYVELVLEKIGINEEQKKQMKAELVRLSQPFKYQFLNSPELQTIIERLLNTDILFNELYKKHNSKFSTTVKDKWMKLLAQLTKLQVITTIKKVDLIPVISTIIKLANDKMEVMNDLVVKKMDETKGIESKPEKEFEVPKGSSQLGPAQPSTGPSNANIPILSRAASLQQQSSVSSVSSSAAASSSAPALQPAPTLQQQQQQSLAAPSQQKIQAEAAAKAAETDAAVAELQATTDDALANQAEKELEDAKQANEPSRIQTLTPSAKASRGTADAAREKATKARAEADKLRALANGTTQKYLKLEANKKAYEYYQQKYLKYKSKYLEQ